jgi:putative CocE/NonD family hydrolase
MFTERGYAVVYQDCRGRYQSEGVFRKYLDDAADGFDTCAWLVQQPWCNGKIGTMGLSYAAHTQAALASTNPPGVAAMVFDSGGFANAYQGGIRQGGAFELKQATWAYRQALQSPTVQNDPDLKAALEAVDLCDWFRRMPWQPGNSPLALVPEYEAYLFEQWQHGDFDAYWQQPGLYAEGHHDHFPDCPQIHLSSWYDPYPRTATANYLGLVERKSGPIWLILGPWTHGDRSLTYAGEVDFGPAATLDGNLAEDFWQLRLAWFDRWLQGVGNDLDATPPVRVFVMGGGSGRKNDAGRLDHGGRWRSAAAWPFPETEFTPFYFQPDGGLTVTPPPPDAPPLAYDYDPANPVPSIGGAITSGQPLMVGGAFDQRERPDFFACQPPYRPLAERDDILVFQTEPLEEAVEVIGPIEATLWIASDCPDTDFTAKLIDVYPPNADYPNGFAMNLTDGILRVRYRDSWTEPTLLEPGECYQLRIELFPTANRFERGHRLRVDIASSNFPHFDLNFNTGEPEGAATHRRVAHNQIFVDQAQPSHILLPVARK